MSQFLTALQVEKQKTSDGEFWQLIAPLRYQSDRLELVIEVPVGFLTDFASVPRMPFAYLLAGGIADRAAVVHDWLIEERVCPRAQADLVFLEAMAVEHVPWYRRYPMFVAVRTYTALTEVWR